MSEIIHSQEEQEMAKQFEKEQTWCKRLLELDQIVDGLGHGIDEEIKEPLVALLVNELPTSASCGGHLDHGLGAPWIDIRQPNPPKLTHENQTVIEEKYANQSGLSLADFRRGEDIENFFKAAEEIGSQPELPEFTQYKNKNLELNTRLTGLLEEFYQNRPVEPNVKLVVDRIYAFATCLKYQVGKNNFLIE
jgi:hypothetical protein